MRVLITGNRGYLGPIVVEAVRAAGHDVAGLDSGLFAGCALEPAPTVPTLDRDLRDVQIDDLSGFDAIIHLANLSNDPLGMLDADLTREINVDATVRLALLARSAGVKRFLNSSSCSAYGAASEPWVDESTPPRPVTAYGESKVAAEQGLAELADDSFCVVSLRNATAFGFSPHLRLDLVVNDLVAGAVMRDEVRLLSDGSAWRPIVHVRDIARAFALSLDAPTSRVNGRIFNVGSTEQNYRVIDIARGVTKHLPSASLIVPEGAGADRRSYRVRFDLIRQLLPNFRCTFDLESGIAELAREYRRTLLHATERFTRVAHLRELLSAQHVDSTLRMRTPARLDAA